MTNLKNALLAVTSKRRAGASPAVSITYCTRAGACTMKPLLAMKGSWPDSVTLSCPASTMKNIEQSA